MLTPGIWDHAFVLLVILLYPLYAKLTFRSAIQQIRNHGEPARVKCYSGVILTWVAFATYILVLWWALERDWVDLGIRGSEPLKIAIGALVGIAITAVFVLPLRKLYLNPDRHDQLNEQMGDIAVFMPVSNREEAWFTGVSVNAGLSEELIFRGYLIWYLGHYVEWWVAAVFAALLFALAHLYQGVKMLPGLLFVSASAVMLYVYTGSLLIPILFHIVLDALQGRYVAKIQRAQARNG